MVLKEKRDLDDSSPGLWTQVLLVIAVALLLRATRGYQSFPVYDDFVYVPIAWRELNPELYSRDLILREFKLHSLLWVWLVQLFENTCGLGNGFWFLTILLSVATVAAIHFCFKPLVKRGSFLPLVALIPAMAKESLIGIGRGLYGGVLADNFHVHWLALLLLLWSYGEFIRQREWRAGAALGFSTLVHPVVGFHGALVFIIAALLSSPGAGRRLVRSGAMCFLIALPLIVIRAHDLVTSVQSVTWDAPALIEKGFLFRTPHEFSLGATSFAAGITIALLSLVALVAAILLRRFDSCSVTKEAVGIWAGHGVLFFSAVVFHGPWLPESVKHASVLPYMLHLTRSTPLFILFCSVLIGAAGENILFHRGSLRPIRRALHWVFLSTLAIVFFWYVAWSKPLLLLFVFVICLAWRRIPTAVSLLVFAVVSVFSLRVSIATDIKEAPIPVDLNSLYTWIHEHTDTDSLFIVPPGLRGFRYYAKRSVYVAFEAFPSALPALFPEWRRRLEYIAQPDRIAKEGSGWLGVLLWDRTYARRNSQARIYKLLKETESDYFVFDQEALRIPPFSFRDSRGDERIEEVFSNNRYVVYSLGKETDAR